MAPLPTPQSLSELIGLIYDCALDSARWPVAMEAIRKELGCANAALSLHELPSGRLLMNWATNVAEPWASAMNDYASEVIEQWGGQHVVSALPLDRPAVLSRVNPSAVRFDETTNRYSLEWARPQGLNDVIAIGLARDASCLGSIAFGRHESGGPFTERELAVAELLIPHLQRVSAINRLLDYYHRDFERIHSLLDVLSVPFFLIRSNMVLRYTNQLADDLLNDKSIFLKRNGYLHAIDTSTNHQLNAIISEFRAGSSKKNPVVFPLHSKLGSLMTLYAVPLRGGQPKFDTYPDDSSIALFVSSPDRKSNVALSLATVLYDLTSTEARVLRLAADGASTPEIAKILNIAVSTAKTHIIHVFSKMGVNRQADLMRLVSSLELPLFGLTPDVRNLR